jgi:hypothetical protein
MEFDNEELQRRYDSLPDSRRWQITNLLQLEKSPMLWFYFQRRDADRPRKTELQLTQEFLDVKFIRSETMRRAYIRTEDGNYALCERLSPYPGTHRDELCRTILNSFSNRPGASMKEVLEELEIEAHFRLVNKLRLMLTTNALPFLTAVTNGV